MLRRLASFWASFLASLTIVAAITQPSLAATQQPTCAVAPPRLELRMPERGFVRLKGDQSGGACAAVPPRLWHQRPAGTTGLFVAADGPQGSARTWTITVGVGDPKQRKPQRGLCLLASTAGWRTLRDFRPLSWIDDLDGDGRAEVIVWDSFSVAAGAGPDDVATTGLVAWAYRLAAPDRLAIDWPLSRRLARELSVAYRAPLPAGAPPSPERTRAAEALEAFVGQRCRVPKS